MSKVTDSVQQNISPIIEALGYEVVDVEYKSLPDKQWHLVFRIDSPNGVTLNDCEKVSNAIDGSLEALDPTGGAPYCLDVSSPGLDRPFKTARDFERGIGKEIEIKLYEPMKIDPADPKCKAERVYEGVLTGFGGGIPGRNGPNGGLSWTWVQIRHAPGPLPVSCFWSAR